MFPGSIYPEIKNDIISNQSAYIRTYIPSCGIVREMFDSWIFKPDLSIFVR